ncbi:MAG: hypothetical protein QOE54_3333 [Streptosporangiaceae bacterium]|nr:ABC-type branched-chain amino acid transport system periplasmic component-like protein [Streptosporangiaceae bacterium]MDX6430967.1 hypothetical protein [Streptosporangiaceae bacterium]
MRSRNVIALCAALLIPLSACSSAGGGGKSGTSAASPASAVAAAAKPGPDNNWSTGGLTVNASSLKCATPAPDPHRGITATSIKIGGLGYLTSPTGSSMAGSDVGAKVRFQRANDEGGVYGRKIDFIGMLDDGADPARNGEQAKVLAERDQVFAVAPLMSSYPNYLDTFCKQVVPFFGWGFNTGFCGNTLGFGITGCQLSTASFTNGGMGAAASQLFGGGIQGKTIAIVGEDNASAQLGVQRFVSAYKAAGMKVVYQSNNISSSQGITDPTPLVQAIMKVNPDLVLHVESTANAIKLTGALNAAGYKGAQENAVGYDPRLTKLPALNGSYTVLQWAPAESDVAAVKQLVADFQKYAPGQLLSLPAMAGYWSAAMLLNGLKATGKDLTVGSFLNTLNSGTWKNYVPGALPETQWPFNHTYPAPCFSIAQLKAGKYQAVGKLACGGLVAG